MPDLSGVSISWEVLTFPRHFMRACKRELEDFLRIAENAQQLPLPIYGKYPLRRARKYGGTRALQGSMQLAKVRRNLQKVGR
jgi:hypothetical protein